MSAPSPTSALPPCPSASPRSAHDRPWRGAGVFAGFTLVELMAVVAITGILVGMAMPSFREYVAAQAIRAQISDLTGAIRLARTEAIKRGRPVLLCRTADANAARAACAEGQDWSSGWLIRAGESLIRVQQSYPQSGGIEAQNLWQITFLPNGVAQGAEGVFVFRPKLDPNERAYRTLTRRLCIGAGALAEPC